MATANSTVDDIGLHDQRTTVFEARQRIFEAQGIAQLLKQSLVLTGSTSRPAGFTSSVDAIDTLLQHALNGLEGLE